MRSFTSIAMMLLAPAMIAQVSKAEVKTRRALANGEPYKAIRTCDHELLKEAAPLVFRVLRSDALNRIGQYGKALTDARIALASTPIDADALLQAGIASTELGPLDSALRMLTAAVEHATTPELLTEASVRLAITYQQAQRTSLALIALTTPAGRASNNDHDPRVFRLRGECEAQEGDSAAARRDLDKAIELTPRDPVCWNSRGFHRYALFGEHQRAIADYDKAIKLNPNYGYAFNNRGWSRYKLGAKELALRDIALAARKNPHNAFAFRNLGLIALESGDTTAGCHNFQAALAEGFTKRFGTEVETLMKEHCGGAPNKSPTDPPKQTVPVRTLPRGNAP